MVFEKKLAISGIAGVLVACLIILSIVMMPWSELAMAHTTHLSGTCPCAPITVNMSISSFEPSKLGGEANLTVTVTHFEWDSPDTWIEIFSETWIPEEFRGGIIFVSGERKWHGYLNANVPITFDLRIKANKVGNWTVEAHVVCVFTYHLWYEERKVLRFSVTEDNVVVVPGGLWTMDWGISVGMHVSNFTEPQGVGSEAEVTVIMTSQENVSNVTAQIDWTRGFEYVSGNLTWSGDLRAGVPVSFKVRIKATEIGRWSIVAKAEKLVSLLDPVIDHLRLIRGSKGVFIIVFSDRIVLSETPRILY